jgi:hypothetical protein
VRLGGGSSTLGDAVARSRDDRQKDLLRPALEEIIDLGHPLVRLAREIDWGFLDRRFASVCTPGPGQPGLPTRLVAGLFILKHMHNLSDEVLRALAREPVLYRPELILTGRGSCIEKRFAGSRCCGLGRGNPQWLLWRSVVT